MCDGKKIVQKFSRLLRTFEFDREYLRNGSKYQKSEKPLNIYNPSHVRRKLTYFGPETKKLSTLINVHPAPWNFYTLEIDQGYVGSRFQKGQGICCIAP